MPTTLPLLDAAPAPAAAAASLSLNRCLSLIPIKERDAIVGVEITAPVRGEGLRVTRVDAVRQRQVFDLLMTLRDSPRLPGLTLDAPVAETLRTAGVLMPRAEVPRGVRYACFIDGHASDLPLPLALNQVSRAQWIVNPTLEVVEGTGSFHAEEPASPVAEAPALAWVTLPGAVLPTAYWLDAADADLLGRLQRHEIAPGQLNDLGAERFARAGLLTTPTDFAHRERCRMRRALRRREHLMREGWVRLPGLLPRPLLASLQGYVNPLVQEGHLRFNDAQSRRYFKHNEPMTVWLHRQLEAPLQALIAEPVKRSYAFLGSYVPGSDLKRHTDREQCEYTVSITLDAQPGRQRASAWPLGLIDRQGNERRVRLAPGDALLFKGRELPHFRDELADGRTSTSAFLHFVPAGFSGPLN